MSEHVTRALARHYGIQPVRRVVASGVFDILHAGHVRMLQEASKLGGHLAVLINDDASARRLKGPGRPLTPQEDRAEILRALECVDDVYVFGMDDPTTYISMMYHNKVGPDVYVKGSDYAGVEMPEAGILAEHSCELVFIDRCGRSSTNVLLGPDEVLLDDPSHPDACEVLGCVEMADYAHESPMFRTDAGAQKNQTMTYCRIHGDLFVEKERLEMLTSARLESRRDAWFEIAIGKSLDAIGLRYGVTRQRSRDEQHEYHRELRTDEEMRSIIRKEKMKK